MMRDAMVREGLPREEATRRFYALGRRGLLTDDRTEHPATSSVPYARPGGEVAGWSASDGGGIGLAEVVANVRPTMLIGTSTQAGAFTEAIVAGHGRPRRAADHHAAVQPDLQGEALPAGPDPLDRRAGAGRHRQPLRAGDVRRPHLRDRPGQQRAGVPRPRPRRDRRPGPPDHRPDDRRGRRRRRRAVRRHHARGAAAARRSSDLRAVSAAVAIAVAAAAAATRASPRSPSTIRSSRSTRPCGDPSTRGSKPSDPG